MQPSRVQIIVLLALVAIAALVVVFRAPSSPASASTRGELIDSGRVVFGTCALCHGAEGRGDRCPPLVYSDFVQGDTERLIRFVLRPGDWMEHGVRVNGVLWRSGEMPSLDHLSDFQIAAVLTYIRSLNDSAIACTPEDAEAGTWAECRTSPRDPKEVEADGVTPDRVTAVRNGLVESPQSASDIP